MKRTTEDLYWPDRVPWVSLVVTVLVAAAFAFSVGVAFSVFDRLPHVEDEVAFVFQARTVATGHLLATTPPHPEFFRSPFVIVRGDDWFGKYPPGYPLVLGLGAFLGATWIVNPIAGALGIWLIVRFGRRLFGDLVGIVAGMLAVCSPFFLLQSGSLMSHAVSLVWSMLFLTCFESSRRRCDALTAIAAGAALGMLFITRPLTAVGIGLPFALWAAVDLVLDRRRARSHLAILGAFLPFVGALLAYNRMTTGDPFMSAYQLWWPFDRIGFGDGIGISGHHSVGQGLHFTRMNVSMLSNYLFGWPGRLSLAPGLLAVLWSLGQITAWFRTRRIPRRGRNAADSAAALRVRGIEANAWDMILFAMIVSLILVHVAYPTPGQMYGPRYYFEALGAMALLSARGVTLLVYILERAVRHWHRSEHLARPLAGIVMAAAVLSLVAYSATHFTRGEFDRFRGWNSVSDRQLNTVEAARLHNALVFVTGSHWNDFAPFFAQTLPDVDTNVVYAIDRGAESNRVLIDLYPSRSVFRITEGRLVSLSATGSDVPPLTQSVGRERQLRRD